MSNQNSNCPKCDVPNSSQRLWCSACGSVLPSSEAPTSVVDDDENKKRANLYRDVLADLNGVQSRGKVPQQTYESIHSFYTQQLASLERQRLVDQRIQQLGRMVAEGREAAHRGNYLNAINAFKRAKADAPLAYRFDEMIAEVQQKALEKDLSQQVDSLLSTSKSFISDNQLEHAKESLEQAKRLAPDDKKVTAALRDVNRLIAEKIRKQTPSEETIAPRVPQPILIATLADAPSDQTPPNKEAIAAKHSIQPVAESNFDSAASKTEALTSPDTPAPKSLPTTGKMIAASFADDAEANVTPTRRLIESASQWSSVIKPFLLDNVGWFVGAFLVVAGFVVLIVTFRGSIEQNRILMHSLVYFCLMAATGGFFFAAYFMRRKYPQLESSSNVLLVIVALLIPLVFAAAMLTALLPDNSPLPSDTAILFSLR